MDDLDAMLDDAADEMLPTVFDLDAEIKDKKLLDNLSRILFMKRRPEEASAGASQPAPGSFCPSWRSCASTRYQPGR